MAGNDAFKPQGEQLAVVQGVQPMGAELGRHVRQQGQPLAAQPAPRTVQQGGERFISTVAPVAMAVQQPPAPAPAPVAAPPVPSAPQARGSFQPAAPEQSVGQQLGATQPQPPAPASPQLSGDGTFNVYIDGVGPDGAPLTTEPIALQFPPGSTLSGMRFAPR